MINKPTHFINGGCSSTDLTFSSNMSFIRYYGMEPSIFEEYHHNITHGTPGFNLSSLTAYYKEIWDYKNVDTESIQKAIASFGSS